MKVRADTEVAVLSARTDLDLAISTWLPGYVARRTDDLAAVMDITHRGGVVLIDLGSPRHEEWVAALREREFDGPTVFLDPRGDMTIDLREPVVVTSPPGLSGLLAGLELARSQGRGHQRPSDRDAVPQSPKGRHGRTLTAPAREAADASPGQVEEEVGVVGRPRRVDRGQRQAPGTSVLRGRRVDGAQCEQAGGPVSRGRRMDRRHATQGRSFWRSLSRWLGLAGSSLTDEGAPAAAPGPARIDADVEGEFRGVADTADEQPDVRRRIVTPEGRVRVQTEEELFAADPTVAAVTEKETVPTPRPPRTRRTRVGA